MSMRTSREKTPIDLNVDKTKSSISTDKHQTLPRKCSVENNNALKYNISNSRLNEKGKLSEIKNEKDDTNREKSVTKSFSRDIYSPLSDRSARSDSYDIERNLRARAVRSSSLREPRSNYPPSKIDSYKSLDKNDDLYLRRDERDKSEKETPYYNICPPPRSPNTYSTDYTSNISRPSSSAYTPYSQESSTLNKYLTPNKYGESSNYSPTYSDIDKKTDSKKPSTATRKISRFLRPDFYDKPKEESVVVKEKKEREMETQKVLKEIRDKRKNRLHMKRERSVSREASVKRSEDESESLESSNCDKSEEVNSKENCNKISIIKGEDTNQILNNISDSIKNIETNISTVGHEYVIVTTPNSPEETISKKEKVSKLMRPKSYPTDNIKKELKEVKELKETPEKEITKSKIAKIKKESKDTTSQNGKSVLEKCKSPPKATGEKTSNKNKFFQTIEKKFEKLRSFNNSNPSRETSVEKKAKEDKKSNIESAIKRLREQSLPRNVDHCITESGLIKRAVSVEDLPTLNTTTTKELQPSRKSVTKILGLFKKYEEKDKKSEKTSKLKKPKEISITEKTDTSSKSSNHSKTKKGDTNNTKGADKTVINKNNENKNAKTSQKSKSNGNDVKDIRENLSPISPEREIKISANNDIEMEKERPKSLLCDLVKEDSPYKGAKSDTAICNDNCKLKYSKLPVNSFRRSLNLDKTPISNDSMRYKSYRNSISDQEGNLLNNDDRNNNATDSSHINDNDSFRTKPDRRNLKLDLNKITDSIIEALPSTSNSEPNRNSTTTDDSSLFLSPCDDNMSCDSWSVCSDYHTHDLLSPISPNGHIYSGDEGESVIDRIRRKSFYTRFNEKKRPRKASLTTNYRDMDLYKDYSQTRKPSSTSYRLPNDYSSLDRRSVDYRTPSERRSSYNSIPDPTVVKREYKPYVRSSSLISDYVNVPNRYQTYNPRTTRHISSLYSPDNEDGTVDEVSSAGKSRINSFHYQPSRINGRASSVSPSMDNLYSETPSYNKHTSATTTSHTPT